jgi:phage shock protein E
MLERLRRWLQAATQALPFIESAAVPGTVPASVLPRRGTMLVIDVRSEREFQATAVQGAINLPLPQLERRIREVVADEATPIALYCASGARSGIACMMLRQMGYAQVSNAGGPYAAAASLQLELRR